MSRRLAIVSSIATTTLVFAAYALQHGATPASAADLDDHSAHMRAEDRMAPMTTSISGAGSLQGDLSLPASATTTAARLAASPRHGEWVSIDVAAACFIPSGSSTLPSGYATGQGHPDPQVGAAFFFGAPVGTYRG